MRKRNIVLLATAVLLSLLCLCKIIMDSDYALKASDFVISNEVSGWTQDDKGLASYNDPRSLQALMDGGFEIYTDNGMIEGIQEKMSTADNRHYAILVMDFGTPEKASAEYKIQKTRQTGRMATFDYPDTVAIGKMTLTGVTVFAHFSRFYFEIGLTSYSPASKAVADGNLFLGYFEVKANQSNGE